MEGGTFEERAGIVVRDFASNYKTSRNPGGKELVQVCGGIWWQRDAVAEALNRNMPRGLEAYIVKEPERVEDDISYYVDAEKFCEGVKIPEAV
ncbi:hypothetical protein HOA55_01100 [archaeon]|jgi:hypothetical protein|nr:hypothetical protein [archaeon]MBT3577522.1 hypothetical protein [archaeon]MBT6819931.1 hypothetical protein [archaeon]MBT6955861.1 hypothetical protein [archaeon]MBT7025487.1 hypothetical protein [archaeon]